MATGIRKDFPQGLCYPVLWYSSSFPPSCRILQENGHGSLWGCQRLTSALIAEWERIPADSQLSYPCRKSYVWECFSIEFLCSCGFLWKFMGCTEHWIIAAQHAAFHLYGWHSFCLDLVRPPLQAFCCLNPHSFGFWLLGMNLSPCVLYLLGNVIFRRH